MSGAAQRTLARLPLDVFENLVGAQQQQHQHQHRGVNNNNDDEVAITNDTNDTSNMDDDPSSLLSSSHYDRNTEYVSSLSPYDLRSEICTKLSTYHPAGPNKSSGTTSIIGNNTSSIHTEEKNIGIKTVGALLQLSIPTLLRVLDPLLTYNECHELMRRVSLLCAPTYVTAYDLLRKPYSTMLQQQQQQPTMTDDRGGNDGSISQQHAVSLYPYRYIPTGIVALDRMLRGGVSVGTITELVGKGGTGKTQLAMQVCVMASRYCQGSVYIDTEQKMNLRRFREITTRRAQYYNPLIVQNANMENQQNQKQHVSNNENRRLPQYQQTGSGSNNSNNSNNQHNHHSAAAGGKKTSYQLYRSDEYEVMDNVMVRTPTNTEELLSTLKDVEDEILLRNHEATACADSSQLSSDDDLAGSSNRTNRHGTTTLLSLSQQGGFLPSPEHGHDQQHPTSRFVADDCDANVDGRNNNPKKRKFPVRLLVLDSIAAPIRRDFGSGSAPQRAAAVIQCAQILKRLADQLNLCIIVINQIGGGGATAAASGAGTGDAGMGTSSSTFGDILFGNPSSSIFQSHPGSNNMMGGDGNFAARRSTTGISQHQQQQLQSHSAALGMAWHHCVSTRVLFTCQQLQQQYQQPDADTSRSGGTSSALVASSGNNNRVSVRYQRQATIVKSNLVGPGTPIGFTVTSLGLVDDQKQQQQVQQ